jgi:hypothetical protein
MMKKSAYLFLGMFMMAGVSFCQTKKVAVVTFFVDKYIDASKITAAARDQSTEQTLQDDPNFDLRPLLNDFYETFKKNYAKEFPFQLVDEKEVIGNPAYQAYNGLDGVEDQDSLDYYTEAINDRFISIDGYKVLLTGGNLLRSWRTEAHMMNIFKEVDGVMFVYMSYGYEPKVNIGGMGNAGIRAYMHMDLFNKEAKKVFKLDEYATSKKGVPMINGVPIMSSAKVLPLCANATEELLEDMNKDLPKLVKKVNKNL